MKPLITEKAIMSIEAKNTLIFEVDRKVKKADIKKQIETLFKVKIDNINTLIRKNKKYAYIKLNEKNPAIDIATKLGMI